MVVGGSGLAWRDTDIVLGVATALAGLIMIVVAWFGASGSATLTHQVGWLNLAVAGFAVFAGGNCVWLLRGRRAVGERRSELISLEIPVQDTAGATEGNWSELVRGTGMRKVHYADCPLVDGKQVEPADLADGEACGVCAA